MTTLDLRTEAAETAVELPSLTDPSALDLELAENTWRGRMVNEHASARVFAGLLPQLMRAEVSPKRQAEVATMVADELRHARQCAGVLHTLGAEAVGELPELTPIPDHEDAQTPLEVALRNVLSICCLSETVAVALIDAERRALDDNPLGGVLKRILADEVRHARFGWILLEATDIDDGLTERLEDYLRYAFAHLERHELAHLSPVSAPKGAQALGACDGRLARDIFFATIEDVIIPGLEQQGLDGRTAWATRTH